MTRKLTPTTKQNAISGKETLVGYATWNESSSTYATTYTVLPGVTTIGAPTVTVNDIDQTCIAEDSKRTIAGVSEGGDVTIVFHKYTGDATQKDFFDLAQSQETVKICYEYQDESTCEFELQLKTSQFSGDPSMDETLKLEVTGNVQGKPTYTLK